MKTLDQVEPRIAVDSTNTPGDADSLYKITQPGSYYLTGNITGVASKIGIEIAANNVTLDLMGFEMAGAGGALRGIQTTVDTTGNVAIRNGSIRNWNVGIDLSVCDYVVLSDLRVIAKERTDPCIPTAPSVFASKRSRSRPTESAMPAERPFSRHLTTYNFRSFHFEAGYDSTTTRMLP